MILQEQNVFVQVRYGIIKMVNFGFVIIFLLALVGFQFGSGKIYSSNTIENYLHIIFTIGIFIQWLPYSIQSGQTGTDVTFLLLIDKGASMKAVNAFGDGLSAFQVRRFILRSNQF